MPRSIIVANRVAAFRFSRSGPSHTPKRQFGAVGVHRSRIPHLLCNCSIGHFTEPWIDCLHFNRGEIKCTKFDLSPIDLTILAALRLVRSVRLHVLLAST